MLERTSHPSKNLFQPDYIADSVASINFAYLKQQGIRAIFIDLDGTVVPRRQYDVGHDTVRALRLQPLEVYIATNRPQKGDLKNLMEQLHAKGAVHPRAGLGKPFKRYFREALAPLGLRPSEVVMVGDRYLQDIFGGNRAGLATVLVRKSHRPFGWLDRLLSSFETRHTERLTKNYRAIEAKR